MTVKVVVLGIHIGNAVDVKEDEMYVLTYGNFTPIESATGIGKCERLIVDYSKRMISVVNGTWKSDLPINGMNIFSKE